MNCGGGSVGSASSDSKVETISRLAQWRIESFGLCTYRRSDAFKVGIWNWYMSVEKNRYMYIRLFPEPCRLSKEQPPSPNSCFASPTLLRTSDDFVWPIDSTFNGKFIIDVEFLDLKISLVNGSMQSLASKSSRHASRMLEENIHSDITINTPGGTLRAHKAILSASSPSSRACSFTTSERTPPPCGALLNYLYGIVRQEEFWKHARSFSRPRQVRSRRSEAVLRGELAGGSQLRNVRAASFLFDFGKIYDVRDDINGSSAAPITSS
ncbi:unnamed protein product [Spirodela intermedia]|uniref:Uncharacterized protein n=1 Tax=Spirodela intermedia TaxID=51605 RepID=A0A7I8JC23_SPIIN|nr:unnamed protein product [Spirodela intermedia]CAA6667669.1 unnamed protein product [Spirodela intermedia]